MIIFFKKWVIPKLFWVSWGLGAGFVSALVVVVICFEIGIRNGFIPDSSATSHNKTHPRITEILTANGILSSNEVLIYFYSSALFDVLKDGNLFTDDRVVSYQQGTNGLEQWAYSYTGITNIYMADSGSFWDDATVVVETIDNDWFVLYVSAEGNGHRLFFNKLINTWHKYQVE